MERERWTEGEVERDRERERERESKSAEVERRGETRRGGELRGAWLVS